MKQYRTYLVIILLVMILLIAVVLTRRYGGFSVNSNDFTIKHRDRVTAIILETKEERLTLTRSDSGWIVNNRYDARPSAIRFLLETLSRVSVKSTVPESQFRAEWTPDSSSVIRVHIREKPGRAKSFFLYPVTTNPYGNYVKKREKGVPFILNIPGYAGNVGSLFVTSEKFWLPHILYSGMPSEIEMVEMLICQNEPQSFVIYQENPGSVELLTLPGKNTIENLDTGKVYRYLSYFNHIRFERWVLDSDSVDTHAVRTSQPLHKITIREHSGKHVIIRTYPIVRIQATGEQETDLNRVYAGLNDKEDLVIVRYIDLDPVLKERNYFVLNDKE